MLLQQLITNFKLKLALQFTTQNKVGQMKMFTFASSVTGVFGKIRCILMMRKTTLNIMILTFFICIKVMLDLTYVLDVFIPMHFLFVTSLHPVIWLHHDVCFFFSLHLHNLVYILILLFWFPKNYRKIEQLLSPDNKNRTHITNLG